MLLASWKEIEEHLDVTLESVGKNDAYINTKFTTQEGNCKTNFHGAEIPFNCGVKATTILKIGNVYKQGQKYYLQVFVKEYKISELNTFAKSFRLRPTLKNGSFPITCIAKKKSSGQRVKLFFTLFKLNITFYFKCYLHHNCNVNLN